MIITSIRSFSISIPCAVSEQQLFFLVDSINGEAALIWRVREISSSTVVLR